MKDRVIPKVPFPGFAYAKRRKDFYIRLCRNDWRIEVVSPDDGNKPIVTVINENEPPEGG